MAALSSLPPYFAIERLTFRIFARALSLPKLGMSHCDIELDWTFATTGAWFGVCKVPRINLYSLSRPMT